MGRQYWKPSNMLNPVPAVLITCADEEGNTNVMTAAWAGTVCSDPVMVSVSIRKERHSHDIIARTGEFVMCLTTEEMAKATDFAGVRSGRDIDKFSHLKLTKVPSRAVSAPSIGESPVCLECVVTQIENLGTHDLFIAKVVQVSVDEQYLDENGRLRLDQAGLIAYVHGAYLSLGDKLGTFGFSVRKRAQSRLAEIKQTGERQTAGKQTWTKRIGTKRIGAKRVGEKQTGNKLIGEKHPGEKQTRTKRTGKKSSAAGRQTTKKNTSAHGRSRRARGAKIEGA